MADHLKTVFVSGANRGIGYELTLQLSGMGYQVIAGYRDEKRAALLVNQARGDRRIFPVKVDVTKEGELKKLYEFIGEKFGYLDLLINNAGINLNRSKRLNELEWSEITQHFKVNVGGVFLTTKHLYPLLKKGRSSKIVNLGSKLGSIEAGGEGSISYCLSKSALNMLTRQQAHDFRSDGITVISISPGWVRTDMGGSDAFLSVQESVARLLNTALAIPLSRSGQFMDVDGHRIPF